MAVNYNQLADRYDERYRHQRYLGVQAFLTALVNRPGLAVLEVGCGTGHWLSKLADHSAILFGIDRSIGMLGKASSRIERGFLACAPAENLPFSAHVFDLIFCVNAFHHFPDPQAFLAECSRLLKDSGRLAIVGLDPHLPDTNWYLYDYFADIRELDLQRYHAQSEIKRLMLEAGFQDVSTCPVEHLHKEFAGKDVWADPFLERQSTSQLQLISEEQYREGRSRIASAIRNTEGGNQQLTFTVNLTLVATLGTR